MCAEHLTKMGVTVLAVVLIDPGAPQMPTAVPRASVIDKFSKAFRMLIGRTNIWCTACPTRTSLSAVAPLALACRSFLSLPPPTAPRTGASCAMTSVCFSCDAPPPSRTL